MLSQRFGHIATYSATMFIRTDTFLATVHPTMLKNHEAGPKPCDNIAKAAKEANTVTDMCLTVKKQRTATAMDSMPVMVNETFAPLYQKVTPYAAEKVISIWHSTHEYAMYRKQHDGSTS